MTKPVVYLLGVLSGVALSFVVGPLVVGFILSKVEESAPELLTSAGPGRDAPPTLAGTFACPSGCIYTAVEFRTGGHAVVHGMGMTFPTTFSQAGDRVYVRSDKGDLGFRVVDADTLEGEGWADGTYRRR